MEYDEKKELTPKQLKVAKKMEKKAAKLAKKQEKKARFKQLSLPRKIWYFTWRIALVPMILLCAFFLLKDPVLTAIQEYIMEEMEDALKNGASEEVYLEGAPLQEENPALAYIPNYNEDDTWAFYIYMCGSNLESYDVNELSYFTDFMLAEQASENSAIKESTRRERFSRFMNELQENNMDMPSYLYLIEPQMPSEETVKTEVNSVNAGRGNATKDLDEIFTVELPENVNIVFQTGGAKRWSFPHANPNRSQRFVYDTNGVRLVDESQIQDMGNPQTVTDFLNFCEENYDADHKVLIFWDHGSGVGGLCHDEIFNNTLTLPELQKALTDAYGEQPEEKPLEMIGYDACLMASLEVSEFVYPYAKYMVGSEELEPGDGWNYHVWLSEFVKDTSVNGAQLGKYIVDSFTESYAAVNNALVFMGKPLVRMDGTLSVIDLDKAHQTYQAYANLSTEMLRQVIEKPTTMAKIGRAAQNAIKFGSGYYNVINTIDLGTFLESLENTFPTEASNVHRLMNEAVLYRRATKYFEEAQGISVYFPTTFDNTKSLITFLAYLDEAAIDPSVKALAYYRVGGCLNEELQTYVSEIGLGEAKVLNSQSMDEISTSEITITENGFSVKPSISSMELAERYSISLAKIEEGEESNAVIYYGLDDSLMEVSEDGTITANFDGKWLSIDGQPLDVEVVNQSDASVTYRSLVELDGTRKYLLIEHDLETDTFQVIGTSSLTDAEDIIGRSENEFKVGSSITPIYEMTKIGENENYSLSYEEKGKPIKYDAGMKISYQGLDSGEYVALIVAHDVRSDQYYSAVVSYTISNGKVTKAEVDSSYSVRMS